MGGDWYWNPQNLSGLWVSMSVGLAILIYELKNAKISVQKRIVIAVAVLLTQIPSLVMITQDRRYIEQLTYISSAKMSEALCREATPEILPSKQWYVKSFRVQQGDKPLESFHQLGWPSTSKDGLERRIRNSEYADINLIIDWQVGGPSSKTAESDVQCSVNLMHGVAMTNVHPTTYQTCVSVGERPEKCGQ